ncbi:hypothetical protein [Lactobacillus sp. PV034]|uniref:hypothetical protein n=1 Tax=Lactobacillus sp. PV034 TaxID=2594495 RepID=UPI00223EA0A0|nr:hypothetical protein [Lactobacillus sp. PV034]QNQ80998.1 hypothetical protein FP432_05240 [Lactobacillus sp. PV034]
MENYMDQNNQNKQEAKQSNIGKIIAGIIAGIVIVCGVVFLILEMTKPSGAQALSSAKNEKVSSIRARANIKTDEISDNTLIEYNDQAVHSHVVLKSGDDTKRINTWILKNKTYAQVDGKWYYKSSDTTDFKDARNEVKESTNIKQFLDLPTSAANLFKVSLDGITGYTLTYSGSNQKIMDSVVSDAKKVNITIHMDHTKNLHDISATAKLKNGGSTSIQVYDVNNVKDLNVPANVKKAANADE